MPVDADLDEVSRLLSSNFGETLTLTGLEPVLVGQNSARHFVATVPDGRKFGLKASVGGVSQEETAGAMARMLHAPNATRYAMDPGRTLGKPEGLSTLAIVKVEWLPGDTANLGDPLVRADILREPEGFYYQFGQWMATGLFLGISDRDNPGNWVWDKSQRRLQMIDFEYAFKARTPEDYTRFLTKNQIGLADPEVWRKRPNYYPPGLMRGFLMMRYKIRRHFTVLSGYLESRGQGNRVQELRVQLADPDLAAFNAVERTVVGPGV